MSEYLKLPEVARRLDVSEKTARRYIKSGALSSVFIGGAYRVSEEGLEAFVEAAKVTPGGDSPKAQSPLPLEDQQRAAGIEVRESYFVPLEEGEEEDTVTVRLIFVQLLEGDEPILKAMREASPEEAAKARQQREKAGRTRE